MRERYVGAFVSAIEVSNKIKHFVEVSNKIIHHVEVSNKIRHLVC